LCPDFRVAEGATNQSKNLSKERRCSDMTAIELLTTLQRQGFNLLPLPEGQLAVKPAEKLTDSLREAIRQRKAEMLALLTKPYINNRGELIIPFDCDLKYRWWAGGQSVAQILVELNAPPEVWRRYVAVYTETVQ
jgi:hypothetical protein